MKHITHCIKCGKIIILANSSSGYCYCDECFKRIKNFELKNHICDLLQDLMDDYINPSCLKSMADFIIIEYYKGDIKNATKDLERRIQSYVTRK